MQKTNSIRDIVIIIAIIISLYKVFFESPVVESIETTIEEITEKKENTKPISIKPIRIYKDYTDEDGDIILTVDTSTVKAKEYTYIDSLANGVLTSKITADNIYERNINLKTYNKETKKTVLKNLLFLEVETTKFSGIEMRDASLGLNYVNKNKWSAGVKVGYDFSREETFYGVKFGIPLN